MLKVLKELTGKGQAFPAFGADEPDILRDRRSIQVSASLVHVNAFILRRFIQYSSDGLSRAGLRMIDERAKPTVDENVMTN